MAGIEFLQIGKEIRLDRFPNELRWNEVAYNKY